MTIAELIQLLQERLTKHGDLPVFLSLYEGEFEIKVEVTKRPEVA
jgi:hypothetical protein